MKERLENIRQTLREASDCLSEAGDPAKKAADSVVKSVNKSKQSFNSDAKPAEASKHSLGGYVVGLPSVYDEDRDFTVNDLIEKVVDGMGSASFKYKSGTVRNPTSYANDVLFEGPDGWLAKMHNSHTDKKVKKKIDGKRKTVKVKYWMSHIMFWKP